MTGYYRGAAQSTLRYLCYAEGFAPDARGTADLDEAVSMIQGAPNGRVRIIDTRDGRHMLVERTEHGLHVGHAKHPDSTVPEQRAFGDFFTILTALRRARNRFLPEEDTQGCDAKRREGEKRLWQLFEKFYRDRTVELCKYLKERDREANAAMETTAQALRDLGYNVRVTPAEQTSPGDIKFARLITGLQHAESGEVLAKALRQETDGDERREEPAAA